MNDIEKAIEYLKEPIGKPLEVHYKAIKLAIKALEKQIPKKPTETFTDGAFKRPYNICPVCENYVNRIYHRGSCGKCSQILDWSVGE